MGSIRTTIKLLNPLKDHLAPFEVVAVVDTGALNLCVPECLAKRLDFQILEYKDVIMPDGRTIKCPYVGPVMVQFENRKCYTGALTLGDEIILGTIPLEDMDLLIHPASHSIILNPNSPHFVASGLEE